MESFRPRSDAHAYDTSGWKRNEVVYHDSHRRGSIETRAPRKIEIKSPEVFPGPRNLCEDGETGNSDSKKIVFEPISRNLDSLEFARGASSSHGGDSEYRKL